MENMTFEEALDEVISCAQAWEDAKSERLGDAAIAVKSDKFMRAHEEFVKLFGPKGGL